MKILIVHQNFPGQYLALVRHLAPRSDNQVVFLTQRSNADLPGVRKIVYQPKRTVTAGIHHYLRDTEGGVLNAQEVARQALALRNSGFTPDIMLGHNGWGEIWYLKEIFPQVPLIGYFEFFYRSDGADVGFEPTVSVDVDTGPRIRTKNIGNLLGLDVCDMGQCPTHWQRSLYPPRYHSMLQVVHEGIDTRVVTPNPAAKLRISEDGPELSAGDEIVTYVARNLEAYRGFPSFMRSLPVIFRQRPNARVVVIGGDEVSYGARLPEGKTYKQELLQELNGSLDLSRIHFLGKVPYPIFLRVLQVSRVHVYLTYPFVLSWSLLEAMSAGCLVIASRTPPVQEVVRDGDNGLLVDLFDTEQIADRIVAALSEKVSPSLRANARRTIVEQYDLHSICLPAQLRLLRQAIAPPRASLWRAAHG